MLVAVAATNDLILSDVPVVFWWFLGYDLNSIEKIKSSGED